MKNKIQNDIQNKLTTIAVTYDIRNKLARQGVGGESFNDILKKILLNKPENGLVQPAKVGV